MKTIRWIILISLAVLAFACKPQFNPPQYYLEQADRQMIPYAVGDLVRFVNANNDAENFTTIQDTVWWSFYEEGVSRETQRVTLQSENSAYKFFVTIEGSGTNRNTLIVGLSDGHPFLVVSFCYDKTTEEFRNIATSLYDSLLVGKYVYYKVAMAKTSDYNPEEQQEHVRIVYYNKSHGILQLKDDGKTIFTLDTIIFADKR